MEDEEKADPDDAYDHQNEVWNMFGRLVMSGVH